MQSLDGKHTLFGEIAEDEDGVVAKLNGAIVDAGDRPLQNIRIRRTEVLDDPFDDPERLSALVPEESPEAVFEFGDRLEEDWAPEEDTRCAPPACDAHLYVCATTL
jgi:peptidyl-prolyl cis-trans isomerase-like 4